MAQNKKKKKHSVFWFIVKLQFFLMLIVGAGVGYYFYAGYGEQVQQLRNEAIKLVVESDKNTFIPGRTSTIYDAEGKVLSELKGAKDAEYVEYQDIPPYFSAAMVAIEDKKFYSHNGIDYKAILRAAKAIIQDRRISQGGSTITMQLARNIYLDTSKNWQRKVKEMYIALELEKIYSKNQIMEFYLNNIYFANGYYGISSACKGYFDCELSELSLSQTAFLCAIPNNPTIYDPLTNMENTLGRRDRILKQMYEDNMIDIAAYESATREEIKLKIPKKKKDKPKNSSVDTFVLYCATKALMESNGFEFKTSFESEEDKKEYNEEYDEMYSYCQKKLYTEGYKIYTSINSKLQKSLQKSVDDGLKSFKDKDEDGIYKMQGAAVTIDNDTGYVAAIVGSRSQDFSGYTLNRAYQSHRQPGSSIKPLIVYTPAFETGKYDPDSIVEDKKIKGGPNQSSNSFAGKVSMKYAVAHSLNSVAWQLYDEITPEKGLSYIQNMNFSKIVEADKVLATSLGGFTNGVSPLEMASAYATIVNDGLYRTPTCVKSIVDSHENIIYTAEQMETIIYTEKASRKMVSCLTEVMKSGTGRSLGLGKMPSAGKTGTTNSQKDGWFCGFTRYYTTAVWVGMDIPKKVDGLQGASYPGRIWNSYMSEIHEGLKPIEFAPYAQISDDIKNKDKDKDSEDQDKDKDKDENKDKDKDQNQDDNQDSDKDKDPDNNQDSDKDQNQDDNQDDPLKPDNPDNPDDPDKDPDNPDNPDNPDDPDNPDKPDNPVQPQN